jgi:hypothetical protein
VLVFPQPAVATKYAELFQTVWDENVQRAAYLASPLSGETFAIPGGAPGSEITFAPYFNANDLHCLDRRLFA